MLGDQLLEQDQLKRKQQKLFEQQKKFRNLQTDKKYFADQTINAIKKQKMITDKLKKENEALKQLIAKVNNERNQENAYGASFENTKDLLNQINLAIQTEKETQKNIDTHINNFQKKIIEKRKNCMGINSGVQSQNNLQKQIKILENRLDKANQKFNETIAVNRQLKNVIDSLRRQRVIFDNLYQKLEKELHEKRKKMADIIEKANNSYQQRDKANNQVQVLKQQAKKEASEFEREIKEMSHLMEKLKLTSFVNKVSPGKGQEQGGNFYDTQPQHTQLKNTKPSKKTTEQVQKVQKFREDFAKIQAATQIQNFDELLRIFSDNQEKNFQMFKFVNLQSNEIEQLQIQVARLKDQLETQKPKTQGEGKEVLLDQLESQLKMMNRKLFEQEQNYKNLQREAKSLSNQIERIFETIECDREVAKQVGGSKTISETNLLVFLAVIQHKAIQIVNTFKQLSNSNMMMGYGHKPTNIQPAILTFEDFEDNEEYDKILTADELRKKAADFILKEQGQKQKKKEIRSKKK